MGTHSRPAGILEGIGYWAQNLALHIWGPAQLDDAHDPLVHLKEEHEEFIHENDTTPRTTDS